MSEKRISVVLAHPDDETFGMGGTLAKYADQKVAVNVILATRGEAGIPGLDPDTTGMRREAEARAACAVLGVDNLTFLGFMDGTLSAVPDEVAVPRLVQELQQQRPDIVLTFGPDGVSGHPDHVTVSRWTTRAFHRLSSPPGGPRKLYYLAPSEATEQACGGPPSAATDAVPTAAVDISEFKIRKVRAMQQHSSQHPPFPGSPEVEASKLACHEVFHLARPRQDNIARHEDDLFSD